MKVTIDKEAKTITIVAELQAPQQSVSGKTMVIASTHGNLVTEARWEGKPVTVGLNCYYKP